MTEPATSANISPSPGAHPKLRTRLILMFVLVGSLVGCDQVSKLYVQANWKHAPPQSFLNDWVRIQYAENQGAFLSVLANCSPTTRFWCLTVGNAAALIWVAAFLLMRHRIDYLSLAAFLLILAGGIGNLIDRIVHGIVVDFLIVDSGWGWLRTGIFNVADMAITVGAILLIPQVFHHDESSQKTNETLATSSETGT